MVGADETPISTPENNLYIASIKTQSIGTLLTNLAENPEGDINGIQSMDTPEPHLVGAGLPPETLDKIVGKLSDLIPKVPDLPNTCGMPSGDGLIAECVRKLQATVQLPYYLADSTTLDTTNCTADLDNQADMEFWFDIDGVSVEDKESYAESYRYTKESCPGANSMWTKTTDRNPIPKLTGMHELAVQVVLPNTKRSTKPAGGWPVVIFAHGITAAKEFGNGGMLMLDNFVQAELANQGYAVISIDQPLHGTRAINLDGDDTYEISASQSMRGLFPNNEESDVKNYLKADATLTSRDNLRQSVADLINLRASLETDFTYVDENGVTQIEEFDPENVYVMGHSMGAIASASFSGIVSGTDLDVNGTILANPGGGVSGVMLNSVWLGDTELPPAIHAMKEYRLQVGEALGLTDLDEIKAYAEANPEGYKQTSDKLSPKFMSEFQYLMQSVVDTVDPINFADAMKNTPMLSISVVGSITEQPELKDIKGNYLTVADQTVPIRVELDSQTVYESCNSRREEEGGTPSDELGCNNGSSFKPYYSLNNTEFPLAGAGILENSYGLNSVFNSTDRSFSRLMTGTHNIGAGTMTGSETEGSSDYKSVDRAATELAVQAASFVQYTLDDGGNYVKGSHRIAPSDIAIIEKERLNP